MTTIVSYSPGRGDFVIHEFVFSLLADFPVAIEVHEGTTLKIRLIKGDEVRVKYGNGSNFEFTVPIHCSTLKMSGFAKFATRFVEGNFRHKFKEIDSDAQVTKLPNICHFSSEWLSDENKLIVNLVFE